MRQKHTLIRKFEAILPKEEFILLYLSDSKLTPRWLYKGQACHKVYAKITEEMKREALHNLSKSDKSVFNDDVTSKYANDEDVLKRLCGLK